MFVWLALLALMIEAAVGYPDRIYRRIGHPVTWMGALISWLDSRLNQLDLAFAQRRGNGVLAVMAMLGATIAAGCALVWVLATSLPSLLAWVIVAMLASTLLAQRSLFDHVAAVANALEQEGLKGGRRAVSLVVGRDPETLDDAGVCRAAIESLAENFADGVVAPVFWLAVAGLPGAAAYKAINTADSMIGHKSDRYLAFGWAAARLDDLMNLPASRLAALWLIVAAWLLLDASAGTAVGTVRRDAAKHRSPNAGWPEAAMAGALGLRLAGPRVYAGELVDDHWMGDGRANATAADIRAALSLYRVACLLQAGALAVIAVAISWLA